MNSHTTRDRDLLLATLAEGDASLLAWSRWQLHTDIERLVPAESALLPALSRRLDAHGVRHPWVSRLRGVYRHAWTTNQLVKRDLLLAVEALNAAGVAVVAPGGLPVVASLFDDFGARPCDGVELIVASDNVASADEALTKLGWRARNALPPHSLRPVLGPATYARSGHRNIIIHMHAAPAPVGSTVNRRLLSRARIPDRSLPVPVLDDPDLFVLLCVHHRRRASDHILSWTPEALLLLRRLIVDGRANDIWTVAAELGVVGRVAAALEQLNLLVGDAIVPIPLPERAVQHRDDRHAWISFDAAPSSTGARSAWQRSRARYLAWTAASGSRASVVGFAAFMVTLFCHEWGTPAWKLPFVAFGKLVSATRAQSSPERTGTLLHEKLDTTSRAA